MTAARQEDLQALGQILQERLQADIPQGSALKIGCAISDDGTLVVLNQHPPEVNFDQEKVFAVLQQALESLRPQVTQPVKLYLRVAGQKQAYAKHDFTLRSLELETPKNDSPSPVNSKQVAGSVSELRTLPGEVESKSLPTKHFSQLWQSPQREIPLPILVVGGGVVLATLLSSLYMLTRPCVIGGCKPLQTAQQLNQAANHTVRWADSPSDLFVAQQQLSEANNSLQPIPRWSSRYQEANQLSQTLSTQSAMLDRGIAAFRQASVAARNGQNPPHTAQEWQAIQTRWQEAIAILAAVPKNTILFPLAQKKLSEYQANLNSVDRQLQLEQQASKNLTLAKNTAVVAKKRQDTAQSWQAWQQVKATWQTAVNTLVAIPNTTTAYQEAQQLLKNYRTQLVTVSDRSSREQMAVKALSEAKSFANLAERDQQQNQFTKAVNHWKQALNSAYQAPSSTQSYQQIQPLIASYSSSLQQAEAKLREANVVQKARTELNRACSGKIRVCNYTVNNQLILVYLTSGYEKSVERNYINAKVQGNSKLQSGIVARYRTLKQALEAISDNAGIPLTVYQANGLPIHRYQPSTSRRK